MPHSGTDVRSCGISNINERLRMRRVGCRLVSAALRLRRHLSAEIYRELQLCDAPHVFNGLFAVTIASGWRRSQKQVNVVRSPTLAKHF